MRPAFVALLGLGVLAVSTVAAAPRPAPSFSLVPQSGHAARIASLDVSPDGRWALTASADGSVKLWELSTGREVQSYAWSGRSADERRAVFSGDGRSIYMSLAANNAVIFDVLSGSQVGELVQTGSSISRSRNGKRVAIASAVVGLLDAGPKQRGSFAPPEVKLQPTDESGYFDEVLLDGDGGLAAVTSFRGVFLWRPQQKTLTQIPGLERPPVGGMVFSQKGHRLFVAQPKKIVVVDTAKAAVVSEISGLAAPQALALSAADDTLAGVGGGVVALWAAPFTGAPRTASHATHEARWVAFAGASTLVTAAERSLVQWSMATLTAERTITPELSATRGLAFSPSGRRLAVLGVGRGGASVDLWNLDEARRERSIPLDAPRSLAFSADGARLFVEDTRGLVAVATDTGLSELVAPPLPARRSFFADHHEGTSLRCGDDRCQLWDVAAKKAIGSFASGYLLGVVVVAKGEVARLVKGSSGVELEHLRVDGERLEILWKYPVKRGSKITRLGARSVLFAEYGDAEQCDLAQKTCVARKLTRYGAGYSDNVALVGHPSGVVAASGSISGELGIYERGGDSKPLSGHRRPGAQLAFSADAELLGSGGEDGGVRLWDVSSGTSLAWLLASGGQWLVTTPDGYFDASNDGGSLVSMVRDNHAFGIDQFALRNNRPDLILERLASPRTDIRDHYRSRYLRRLERAGLDERALTAELQVPDARIAAVKSEGREARLSLVFADPRVELRSYNVYVDDVPVHGARGKSIRGKSAKVEETLVLTPGLNKIEVSATNASGAESFRALATAERRDEVKGKLWFVAFGVSRYQKAELDLAYAHKDAQDLGALFTRLGAHYDGVELKVVVDADVTPDAIRATKSLLEGTRPEDTVVLFIAGHGLHDTTSEARYYYLTHGADPDNLAATAADFETIEDLLQGIGARTKLFLMDTCESGELEDATWSIADASEGKLRARSARGLKVKLAAKQKTEARPRAHLLEPNRFIYNDLLRRTGAIVFSSSKGGELSYESATIQNGYFTHAVLAALGDGRADENQDRRVTIEELRRYVTTEVARATAEAQHPTIDRDNLSLRLTLPTAPR